jgi:vacuolar-type H+-ATPase subunit I/STV1
MIALLCIIIGAMLLGKSLARKEDKEKGFIVILGGAILLFCFFPGLAILIVGLILLAMFGIPAIF